MTIESRRAQYITVNGEELIIFSSNDYLGLSHRREVIDDAASAIEKFGCGTGGAPGTSGTTQLHDELAAEIAGFKHRKKAVIFPSGYAANTAIHQSLGNKDTIFFSDGKNHPSASDGIRLSGCDSRIYKHLDYSHLEELLKEDNHSRKIVTTCSVFTIDGAICPLDVLAKLKRKYGFILILDEAHATGCIGKTGRGLEELYSLEGEADFIMGTFSKALGSQGGFLAFSEQAEKLLVNLFRPYEYSTSISAPVAAASLRALSILRHEPELVTKMRTNITMIYDALAENGFKLNDRDRHIVNVYFGDRLKTMRIVQELHRHGYFVVPINLDGCWGLRITAMAVHSEKQINDFCERLLEIRHALSTND